MPDSNTEITGNGLAELTGKTHTELTGNTHRQNLQVTDIQK